MEKIRGQKYLIRYRDGDLLWENLHRKKWKYPKESAERPIWTDLSYAFAKCINICDDKMHALNILSRFEAHGYTNEMYIALEDVPGALGCSVKFYKIPLDYTFKLIQILVRDFADEDDFGVYILPPTSIVSQLKAHLCQQ